MSKFNIGDSLKVKNKQEFCLFPSDEILMLKPREDISTVIIKINVSNDSLETFKKENKPDYKQSNRYKLSQFIKAQPFKAIELSVAVGHQATYLSSTASKSRFESRGDISDAQLKEIKEKVLISVDFNKHLDKFDSNSEFKEKIEKMASEITKPKLLDFKFEIPKNSIKKVESEFKKLADGCRNMGNAANQAGLSISKFNQQVKTKSIQVSKKSVWFTVFLITVLIVSLLATLIYSA